MTTPIIGLSNPLPPSLVLQGTELGLEYLSDGMPRSDYAKPEDAGIDLVMDYWIDGYGAKRYLPLELRPGVQVIVGTGVNAVILPYDRVAVKEIASAAAYPSDRGSAGFGSTGR